MCIFYLSNVNDYTIQNKFYKKKYPQEEPMGIYIEHLLNNITNINSKKHKFLELCLVKHALEQFSLHLPQDSVFLARTDNIC
jgi:hypothetical protein